MATNDAPPRILLVEDNPLHARLVVTMLDELWPGFDRLVQARRLDEAVDELTSGSFDVVLLDLVLPDADGVVAVGAVREADPDVPVVVLSSHDDDTVAGDALEHGAQDYLIKGKVDAPRLLQSIRYAMRRHAAGNRSAPRLAPVPDPEQPVRGSAAMAVIDRDGVIRFLEETVAEMLGRPVHELVGAPLEALSHPEDVAVWRDALGRAGATPDSSTSVIVRFRHGSGHDQRVTVGLEGLRGASGEVEAYLASYHPQIEEGTVASGGTWVVMSGLGS